MGSDLSSRLPPELRGVLGVKSLALIGHLVHGPSLQEFHRGYPVVLAVGHARPGWVCVLFSHGRLCHHRPMGWCQSTAVGRGKRDRKHPLHTTHLRCVIWVYLVWLSGGHLHTDWRVDHRWFCALHRAPRSRSEEDGCKVIDFTVFYHFRKADFRSTRSIGQSWARCSRRKN